MHVCIYPYMYVFMHVCLYGQFVHVSVCMYVYLCMRVHMNECMNEACMCLCISVYVNVFMHECVLILKTITEMHLECLTHTHTVSEHVELYILRYIDIS